MTDVLEINHLDDLDAYRPAWDALLGQTAGTSFFQSFRWLEIYWKHFGAGQKLRVLVVTVDGRPDGILPLVVRTETCKVGRLRVLTYPLHDWGSFYGPIGPDPAATLEAGMKHVRRTRRDWEVVELRWLGRPGTDPGQTRRSMLAAGFQAYQTLWNRTAIVELHGTWDEYFARRTSHWRNNFRRAEKRLARRGKLCYVRHRPAGKTAGDGDPRWDLYDACEQLARDSWQGSATDGTTLSHEKVRPFLRDVHLAAAEEGTLDLNLLLLDGQPSAFAYNYHDRGYIDGLRAGYDALRSRDGMGGLLQSYAIRDSFRRGDCVYDLGVGSLRGKRCFTTSIVPIVRCGHYPPASPRTQILRLRRWLDSRGMTPVRSIAAGRGQDGAAGTR